VTPAADRAAAAIVVTIVCVIVVVVEFVVAIVMIAIFHASMFVAFAAPLAITFTIATLSTGDTWARKQ